jgi:hypothetical protein
LFVFFFCRQFNNKRKKQTQLLEQIYLPLQLHTRSCRKSDYICPRKKTGTRPPLSSHPNIKGDLTGGCAFCVDFQI